MTSPTKVIAKLEVKETAGMRRFLYPLTVVMRGDHDWPRVRVADENGVLVPSQIRSTSLRKGNQAVQIDFAISMAPNEARQLLLVETGEYPVIPDPITLTANADGSFESRQARFGHRIDSSGRIASVVYGGVEHLANPATLTLNDVECAGAIRGEPEIGLGLCAGLTYQGEYPLPDFRVRFSTCYQLTACKSWIGIQHTLFNPGESSRLTFSLPTTISGGATCDFGVGNGLYGKLQAGSAERVVWHNEMTADKPSWWIGSCAHDSATVRVDAEGYHSELTLGSGPEAWFHLVGQDKALAVAFAGFGFSTIAIGLSADGLVEISFSAKQPTEGNPLLGAMVWYHFLDDIPPIAAATNPASILLPPRVTVLPA